MAKGKFASSAYMEFFCEMMQYVARQCNRYSDNNNNKAWPAVNLHRELQAQTFVPDNEYSSWLKDNLPGMLQAVQRNPAAPPADAPADAARLATAEQLAEMLLERLKLYLDGQFDATACEKHRSRVQGATETPAQYLLNKMELSLVPIVQRSTTPQQRATMLLDGLHEDMKTHMRQWWLQHGPLEGMDVSSRATENSNDMKDPAAIFKAMREYADKLYNLNALTRMSQPEPPVKPVAAKYRSAATPPAASATQATPAPATATPPPPVKPEVCPFHPHGSHTLFGANPCQQLQKIKQSDPAAYTYIMEQYMQGNIMEIKQYLPNNRRATAASAFSTQLAPASAAPPWDLQQQLADLRQQLGNMQAFSMATQAAPALTAHGYGQPPTAAAQHRPVCAHCHRVGHTVETCWILHPEQRQQRRQYTQQPAIQHGPPAPPQQYWRQPPQQYLPAQQQRCPPQQQGVRAPTTGQTSTAAITNTHSGQASAGRPAGSMATMQYDQYEQYMPHDAYSTGKPEAMLSGVTALVHHSEVLLSGSSVRMQNRAPVPVGFQPAPRTAPARQPLTAAVMDATAEQSGRTPLDDVMVQLPLGVVLRHGLEHYLVRAVSGKLDTTGALATQVDTEVRVGATSVDHIPACHSGTEHEHLPYVHDVRIAVSGKLTPPIPQPLKIAVDWTSEATILTHETAEHHGATLKPSSTRLMGSSQSGTTPLLEVDQDLTQMEFIVGGTAGKQVRAVPHKVLVLPPNQSLPGDPNRMYDILLGSTVLSPIHACLIMDPADKQRKFAYTVPGQTEQAVLPVTFVKRHSAGAVSCNATAITTETKSSGTDEPAASAPMGGAAKRQPRISHAMRAKAAPVITTTVPKVMRLSASEPAECKGRPKGHYRKWYRQAHTTTSLMQSWTPPSKRPWWRTLVSILLLCMLTCMTGAVPGACMSPDVITLANGSLTACSVGHHIVPAWDGGTLHAATTVADELQPAGTASLLHSARYTKDPDHLWSTCAHPKLTAADVDKMKDILRARRGCFAHSITELSRYCGPDGPFEIHTDMSIAKTFHKGRKVPPIYVKPRKMSVLESAIRDEKCDKLLKAGMIREGRHDGVDQGQHAANLTLPGKKDANGNITDRRMCGDWRGTNAVTVRDPYMVRNAEECLHAMKGCPFISKMDLHSGFHQIPIHPDHQHKTSFWWGNKMMCFNVMPFGCTNATAKFQRVVDKCLAAKGLSNCAVAFVDDILIFTKTYEEHLQAVAAVLDALHEVGLRVHPEKSVFCCDSVEFLGVHVSAEGLQITSAKLAAIMALPAPKHVPQLRQVLGVLGFSRMFSPNYAQLAAPLYKLLKKNAPYVWCKDQQVAFQGLKDELARQIRLYHVQREGELRLYTDFSNRGLGALLCQVDKEGNERLCIALSRSLNAAEQNYCSWDGEMLAVVWAVQTLRPYLHGVRFKIITDHQPLTFLCHNTELRNKHARWALKIQEYDFEILHRPGSTQPADYVSRFPQSSTTDTTGARLDHDVPPPSTTTPPINSSKPPDDQEPHPSAAALATALSTDKPNDYQRMQHDCHLYHAVSDNCNASYDLPDHHLISEASGMPHTFQNTAPEPVALFEQERITYLRTAAQRWVRQCGHIPRATSYIRLHADFSNHTSGLAHVQQLDTGVVAHQLYASAFTDGIILYEPFGGMCAGLEACLRSGMRIREYIYADTSTASQTVARHRLRRLHAAYPALLPASAFHAAFTTLPMDITRTTRAHLTAAGAGTAAQWLVVAGWPCQDLSPAGRMQGLSGARSGTFYDLVNIIGTLQQMQPWRPPAFLLENTALEYNWKDYNISQNTAQHVASIIGPAITCDAARFGAYAHRLRSYWTNMAEPLQLAAVIASVQRPQGRLVQDILDPGRLPSTVLRSDQPPLYVANTPGRPRAALPTLVATQGSYAYRDGGPGLIFDPAQLAGQGMWVEPNADERERALGYDTGSTAAQGVTLAQRHTITGSAIDAHALHSIFATAWALHDAGISPQRVHPAPPAAVTALRGDVPLSAFSSSANEAAADADPVLLSRIANATDAGTDIHSDNGTLTYLKTGRHPAGSTPAEQRRHHRRAKAYTWSGDQLWRVMPDASRRMCPEPSHRATLIAEAHQLGHYGVKRTVTTLAARFWWAGMHHEVAEYCKSCTDCARRNATFNSTPPQLNSLPIKGMFYRWSVDLFGPLERTEAVSNNHSAPKPKYVMVIVEHFSKWLILVPLPDKEATTTAAAFRQHVLGVYGAPAELVTDQGTEFRAEFSQLMIDSYIDHRVTSAYHPQANGLAERAVQTAKRSLAKMVAAHPSSWETQLPYVMLGYNASVQNATGFSPYQLLHAVPPTVPSSIREHFTGELDLDDPVLAAQSVYARSMILRDNLLSAGNNLAIAQQRDQLRYAKTRAGGYKTKVKDIKEGDYVYLNVQNPEALDMRAHPEILRCVKVKDSGVLTLQGMCGSKIDMHVSACAPCHVPVIDHNIYPTLARPSADLPCEVCQLTTDDATMLLCDACGTGWHMACLNPTLTTVPKGTWICPACEAVGIDKATIEAKAADAPAVPEVLLQKAVGPHTALHGIKVWQRWHHAEDDGPGYFQFHQGTVNYIGHTGRAAQFSINYDDGTAYRVGMAELRRIIANSPAAPPTGQLPAAGSKTRKANTATAGVTSPPNAPTLSRRAVRWQDEQPAAAAPTDAAPAMGITPAAPTNLRRSLRHAATMSTKTIQDVRVADAYFTAT